MVIKVRETVANIYFALRDICGFIMLAGLIFTGIRIVLSSNIPTKRTQYLMLLQDWIIGMILLIFSHIIMIGVFYISDTLTLALKYSTGAIGGLNATLIFQCLISFDSAEQIICLIMLGYLIWLTIIFAIAYFKRFLWICVLIVFAPVISIMYAFGPSTKPIYTRWLKEYMMTVFVQPFHMIIYWVLVSIPLNIVNSRGGVSFSISNSFEIIYALVAISFIRPAEAYMRELFGMNKGIANMASYDSGKQTFDAIKNTITETVKKIGLVAATVATGGVAGVAVKGAGAIGTGAAKQVAGQVAKKEAGKLATSGQTGGNLLSSMQNADKGINEALPKQQSNLILPGDTGYSSNFSNLMNNQTSGSNMTASNITITAGNVDVKGDNTEKENFDNTVQTKEEINEQTDTTEDKKEKLKEENLEFIEGEGEKRPRENFIRRGTRYIKNATDFSDGKKNLLDLASQADSDSSIGKLYNKIKGTKYAEGYERFDDMGGFGDVYKGLNKVRDTFFVTPAPQDWKEHSEKLDSAQKEKIERNENKFIHNDGNKQFIIKQDKLMEKYRERYPNKPEAYIRKLAEDDAEKKLTTLAKSYVPLGINNVETAYGLYQDQKEYGYSPEEALMQSAGFSKFNSNSGNIATINQTYNSNYSTVSEAIPEAKGYYNAGYTNITNMMDVQFLQEKLRASADMAMKIERVLRNNGEVNYKGKDKSTQAKFDEINAYYKGRKSKGE